MPRDLQRSRSGRIIVWSSIFSATGSQINAVAIPTAALLLLSVDAPQYGLLLSIGAIGSFLFLPLAGTVVDERAPRNVAIFSGLISAASLLLLPVASAFGLLTIWLFGIVIAVSTVSGSFSRVAAFSLPPLYLGKGVELTNLNAKVSGIDSTATVLGPPATGLLIQALAAPAAIVLNALMFAFSALALFYLPNVTPQNTRSTVSWWRRAFAGVQVVFQNQALRWTSMATVGMMIAFCGNYVAVTFFLVQKFESPIFLAGFLTAGGIGGIAGAFLVKPLGTRLSSASQMVLSLTFVAVAYAIAALAIYLSDQNLSFEAIFALLAVSAAVADAAMVVYNVQSVTTRQRLAPPETLGRTNASVRMMTRGATVLGMALAGPATAAVGVFWTLLGTAMVAVCVAIYAEYSSQRSHRANTGTDDSTVEELS